MERAGDNDFGAGGSCPRSDRVCWKWTGETSAAWRCWREDAQAFGLEDEEASTEASTRFKCGVVMEGSDVFGGLRALIASGVAKAPLPDYVRDLHNRDMRRSERSLTSGRQCAPIWGPYVGK